MDERIGEVVNRNINLIVGKKIVIYGCTFFAAKIYDKLRKVNIDISAFVDNDSNKVGKRYMGVTVYKPEVFLLPHHSDILVIVCSVHAKEMIASLRKLGYTNSGVLHIDVMDDWEKLCTLEYADERLQRIMSGYEIYLHIIEEYGEEAKIIIAPKASGDIYIACSYLEKWMHKDNVTNYVLVGTEKNMIDIAKIYQLSNTKLITQSDKELLLDAYMFLDNQLNIKLLSGWELRTRNSYFPVQKSSVLFSEKFKYETFGLAKEAKPTLPSFTNMINLEEYKLKQNNTVIIAPYAYSSPAPKIRKNTWERLVERIREQGFEVLTVGYGEDEPPIKNTEIIRFSHVDAIGILEYSGMFIGARSGLCDIISSAKCKKIIIYGGAIRNNGVLPFFSLKENFEQFTGSEIIFDDYTEKEFIEYVITYLTR